ncbi:hypothetical protein V6N11_076908 [Hibiscus sabdariffa]|uniref:RING-type E3 ubiquitin transferase n=1 Tax=Hibiscus sabdariffa TaxID=183260 RepID=A0ABR2TC85_9ROSI
MAMRETLLGFCLVPLLFIAFFIEFSSAIVVLEPLSISFPDLPAKFARWNNTGLCGAIEVADPLDACTPLRNEFGFNKTEFTRFALISRGNCSFEEKIRKAQSGGFSAAIVYDDRDMGNLVYMMVNPKGIDVLAVFVSKFAAVFLVTAFIPPRILSNWRRKNLVKSVDNKIVEALPRVTFSSARLSHCHAGETCAICLEDYKDGEILKFLPCQHDFHSSCVESWLTKWGTFCPVCKLGMITKTTFSEVSEQRP